MRDIHLKYFIFSIDILKHLIFEMLGIKDIINRNFDGKILNILMLILNN